MRLSNSEHESHAWRIREIAPDFRLEDAWALPVRGGVDDFPILLEVMASLSSTEPKSMATRVLFRIRSWLGSCLGWDDTLDPLSIPGSTETTLSARLPEDLRDTATPLNRGSGFTPLYHTRFEWAGELSNKTVHAVMHLAWVGHGGGRYSGQMGVYVKPRDRLGAGYMSLIAPFRRRVVYPALMRQIEHAWSIRVATPEAQLPESDPTTNQGRQSHV